MHEAGQYLVGVPGLEIESRPLRQHVSKYGPSRPVFHFYLHLYLHYEPMLCRCPGVRHQCDDVTTRQGLPLHLLTL
jgi:hypothetical protein